MAAITLLHRTTHPKKDGTCPIAFRIYDGATRWKTTGWAVKESQWKNGAVVKHPDAVAINLDIEEQRAELVQSVKGPKKTGLSFGKALARLIDHYETSGKVAAYHRLLTNKNLLLEAWGTLDMPMSIIGKEAVNKYIALRHKKKNQGTTIKKNLLDISVLYSFVEHEGPNPFRRAAMGVRADPVLRSKLTAEDLTKLEEVPLEGLYDVARDMFLFACYAHGMRFGTVASLTVNMVNGPLLTYRMDKGKKIREVEIIPKMRAIINKYKDAGTPHLFPLLKKQFDDWSRKSVVGPVNAMANAYLKRAAILAGIKVPISMHVARHTFAYRALQNNVPAAVIKDALGQSNFATMQGYLKSLSDEHINEAVRGLF